MRKLDSGLHTHELLNIKDMPKTEIDVSRIRKDIDTLNEKNNEIKNYYTSCEKQSRYELMNDQPFASGGQASIFDLKDSEGSEVSLCLKVININNVLAQTEDENQNKVLERFNLEIDNLISLKDCMNVVDLYACFASPEIWIDEDNVMKYDPDKGGYLYLVMEKLTPLDEYFRSLKRKLKNSADKDQRLFSLLKKLTIDICLALAECEKNKILHRDVKEANILVRENGDKEPDFVLADFGISRIGCEGTVTQVGSLDRIAPEIRDGVKLNNFNSDIYSLGRSIRELLKQLDSPEDCLGFDVFDRVIAKAEERNPERRYTDANEMLEDLKDKLSYDYAKKLFCDFKNDEALGIAYKVLETPKNVEETTNCKRLISIIKHNKAYDSSKNSITDPDLFKEALDEMYELAYVEDIKASYFYFLYWLQSHNRFKIQELNKQLKFLRYSAENGYAFAQSSYGILLYEGRLVDKNEELGFNYIMKAVEQNCYDAKRYLIESIARESEKIKPSEEMIQAIKEDIKDEKAQRINNRSLFI